MHYAIYTQYFYRILEAYHSTLHVTSLQTPRCLLCLFFTFSIPTLFILTPYFTKFAAWEKEIPHKINSSARKEDYHL